MVLVLHLWPPDRVPSGHVVLPGGREPGGAGAAVQVKAAGLGAWAWADDELEVGHSGRSLGLEQGHVSERALGSAVKGVSSISGESCFLAWQRLLMALCPGGGVGVGRGGERTGDPSYRRGGKATVKFPTSSNPVRSPKAPPPLPMTRRGGLPLVKLGDTIQSLAQQRRWGRNRRGSQRSRQVLPWRDQGVTKPAEPL